jgi:poly [ADP-ribose] polymerase
MATTTASAVTVLEIKRYIAVDPKNNNNKYWQYERLSTIVSEPGKKGVMETGDVRITWGRVGCDKPDSQLIMFGDGKVLASKIKSKTNKPAGEPSYTEVIIVGSGNVGHRDNSSSQSLAKEEVKRRAVDEIAGSCKITAELVRKLAEANKHELIVATGGKMNIDLETGIISTAMGVVTLDAVKSARTLLDQMAPYVSSNNTDNDTYAKMLGDYLRLVPQQTPARRGWHTTFIVLDKQTSLLDQLEASIEMAEKRVVDATKAANGGVVPKFFEVKMKLVDDSKVWDKVKKMFYDTVNHGHTSAALKPVRVYEIEIPHMAQAFEADGRKVGNVKLLWHGTRMFNVLSILKRGFVLPNQLSTMQMTGAMYGPGLYFSDQSTKSLNYSYGYWDGGSRDNNCYMFLVDVAMGREYVPSSSGNGKRSGYDSCHAVPGRSGIRNDEQIVYRTSQANIRYLVEFNNR